MQSDESLIAACRAGDEQAWTILVERYQRLIYAIPRRAGLDEDAAAEVFQQVFTTLVEKLDSITQPAQLHAWLVTTTKREAWRVSKERRRYQLPPNSDDKDSQIEFNALIEVIKDDSPLADEMIMTLEEQHRIRRSLSELDDKCRRLLTLLFYTDEPPPYSEIARQLEIREGSIGPTRARCLQKMLKRLKDLSVVCIFGGLQLSVRCAELNSDNLWSIL